MMDIPSFVCIGKEAVISVKFLPFLYAVRAGLWKDLSVFLSVMNSVVLCSKKYLSARGPMEPKSSKVKGSKVIFSELSSLMMVLPAVVMLSLSVVEVLLYLFASQCR